MDLRLISPPVLRAVARSLGKVESGTAQRTPFKRLCSTCSSHKAVTESPWEERHSSFASTNGPAPFVSKSVHPRAKASVAERVGRVARTFASSSAVQPVRSVPAVPSIQDAYRFCRIVNKILDGELEKRSLDEWMNSEHAASVQGLLQYVLDPSDLQQGGGSVQHVQHVQRTLGLLGQNRTLDGAVRVLIAIGAWKPHVLVRLGRLNRDTFSEEVEDLARQYMSEPLEDLDEKTRVDLTHLKTITIDDISTTEIDDGLSVETKADGKKMVWIHIADPTRWLRTDDCIFKEAQKRATSIYIPTGVVPMMPYEIATQTFSLVEGVPNCAFSLGVELDLETGEVLDYTVTPSKVLVDHRLTYIKTDEMLKLTNNKEEKAEGKGTQDQELLDLMMYLAQAAEARWNYRKRNGSHTFANYSTKIRAEIDVDGEGGGDGTNENEEMVDVQIERNDAQQQTVEYARSGQSIVSEMMILAGEVGAKWGSDNGVPLPYRLHYKPVFPNEEDLSEIKDEFAKTANTTKVFTRAVLDCKQPRSHASLGLPYYTQLSSPIRRFNDILVHLQMKSVLRGEGILFSADELAEAAEAAYFVQTEIKEISQECEEYWMAMYFRKHKDKLWDATFLSWKNLDEGMGFVQVDDLGLRQMLRIDTPAIPGDKLQIRVVEVTPRLDGSSVFHFEQV